MIGQKEICDLISSFFDKELFDTDDYKRFQKLTNESNLHYFIPKISNFIVNFLTKNVINTSKKCLHQFINKHNIKNRADFITAYPNLKNDTIDNIIGYCDELFYADNELQNFLSKRILNSFVVQRMDGNGTFIIKKLFEVYYSNPQFLRDTTLIHVINLYEEKRENPVSINDLSATEISLLRQKYADTTIKSQPNFKISLIRGICDHIAGMTDQFAMNEYKRLYGISS